MQLIFIVVVIFFIIGFCFYRHHKKSKVLPQQINEVKELIRVLNNSEIEIGFCAYDADIGITVIEKPIRVNVFGISAFGSEDLYNDFEEDLVLFETRSSQLFETGKAINKKLLPKVILDELSDFCNTKLNVMDLDDNDDRPQRFVSVRRVSEISDTDSIKVSEVLLKGNAVAYESWISLKDHVEELEFVILQWLKDAGEEQNEIIKRFEAHPQPVF